MSNIKLFNVAPSVPDELRFLEELSFNMWWCWHPEATELFERIDPALWREVEGSTRTFLSRLPQSKLEELAHDTFYLRSLKAVETEFRRDVPLHDDIRKRKIAYFSMEFGIHESLRIFSGGLGVLAGDHLKAASDLHLPLVGVGLLYRQGYFRQVLDRNGWQQERYPDNEIYNMPITRALDPSGKEVTISFPLQDRRVSAAVWVLKVGNVPLVLLDTEIPENPPELRALTWRLYGGDVRNRIHQELLLGIGGYKALVAMGCEPEVCHMNEGHAAFLSLARIAHLVQTHGYEPDTALEVVWRSNVFTTHTPVPAGNEVFDINLVRPYLAPLCKEAGVDVERMLKWGIPIKERNSSSHMSMTVLGLRLANFSNGVSRLHGEVARSMWKELWPGRALDEIPIRHITNGIHPASWIATRKRVIFDHYLPADWLMNPDEKKLAERLEQIPDYELWTAHELCRQSLVRYVRQRLQRSLKCVVTNQSESGKSILDPNILTIGFARRFATYKRGTLLLRYPDRLLKLLRNTATPVQFVFAGKAHPADDNGKSLIQQLVQFARQNGVSDRLVFLEDYDIGMARKLVQGVDVWLNNPRRPQEASGTSGMKAAINGTLNLSILDGWWDEAYAPGNGWAIRGNENYQDPEDCDNFEAQELFTLLENEVIPLFYDRTGNDLPTRWIKMMKNSIAMGLGNFSSLRMVEDYRSMFYNNAARDFEQLTADSALKAQGLVTQKRRLAENFSQMIVEAPVVDGDLNGEIHVGDSFRVRVKVFLNQLKPEEVEVQVYTGNVNVHNEIITSRSLNMRKVEDLGDGWYVYEHRMVCRNSGRFGLTARITPLGNEWTNSVPGFICWPR